MPPNKKPLTWLITGSSNGLGLALARQVLASGDNVIATSRNPSKTSDLVQEVQSSPNGKWTALDVSWSLDEIKEVMINADELFDRGIDVVVNNAAYTLLGSIEDVPEEDAKAEFETNVWGPLRVCKAILPMMRQRKRGTIVNVSSLLGVATWPCVGQYSASKYALESMSETLGAEVAAFGIRVLIVEPGSFRTNFLSGGVMQVVEPSEPYKASHVVAKALQDEYDKNGHQPGDPAKACKVIYEAVAGSDERLTKVLRLPLGNDCWEVGVAHFKEMIDEYEVCKEAALSVQIEK